jgi:hypothetical protein
VSLVSSVRQKKNEGIAKNSKLIFVTPAGLLRNFILQISSDASRQSMPYQYKREPLSDGEVNRLNNACEIFKEKFVIWTLLDTHLGVSSLAAVRQ